MPWMIPERYLDEYQLIVIQSCSNLTGGRHWIQGFAGSGKTVLLVHIIMRIRAENPELRICVTSFTHALKDLLKTGLAEPYDEQIEVMTYHKYLRDRTKYNFVLVDEIQDIPKEKIEKINKLAKHLVVAGDNDQSIYKDCSTAEEIEEVLDPEIYRLVTIYRLTHKIQEIVQTILPDTQIVNAPTARMQEVEVTLAKAESKDEEIKWLLEQCQKYSKSGDPSVILLPTHADIQDFIREICTIERIESPIFHGDDGRRSYEPTNELFQESDVDLRYLGNNFGELSDSDNHALTYIMTYHSAKGLDFKHVFLPHLDTDKRFMQDPDLDRRLFFVAMTRSRMNLFLSHSSEDPIHYVPNFPQHLLHKINCSTDLAEQQPPRIIPDEYGDEVKEDFILDVVEIFENRTEDIRGDVIISIIERFLKNNEMTEKLIAQYEREDQSFQDIVRKIEDITDMKEAKDVYNQIGDIIENILEYDEDDDDDNETYEIPF